MIKSHLDHLGVCDPSTMISFEHHFKELSFELIIYPRGAASEQLD
jgi:hypothetical protein